MALRLWWCEEHGSNARSDTKPTICYAWALFLAHGKELGDCRIVEAELTILTEPEEFSAEWMSRQSILQHQREHGLTR